MVFGKIKKGYSAITEKVHDWTAKILAGGATAGGGVAGGLVGGLFGATIAGGLVGLAAVPAYLGIQYLRTSPGEEGERFPFTEVEQREFQATQWFNGKPGPMLEGPGTRTYLKPLLRRARDREGGLETVTAKEDISVSMEPFRFRTKDGLEGTMDGLFTYRIKGKEGAFDYIWNLEPGTDESGEPMTRLETVKAKVESEIQDRIGRMYGDPNNDPNKDSSDARRVEVSDTYTPDIMRELNEGPVGERWGVEIRTMPLNEPAYDDPSKKILYTQSEASAEAQRTRILAEATGKVSEGYLEAAAKYEAAGSDQKTGDIALQLADMDNNQEVAQSAGTIVKIGSWISRLFGGGGQSPVLINNAPVSGNGAGFAPAT